MGYLEGIIPAYAGSTRHPARRRNPTADHPRIRGEHEIIVDLEPGHVRIIPAYAGSTPPHPTAPSSPPDHPRIRGEHAPAGGSVSR